MRDGVDHYVENGRHEDPVTSDQWEIWLSLAAQSDLSFRVLTAEKLAHGRILSKNAKGEEIELRIV